ncbi:Mnt2p [Sugiyamaella lignohabitans]|uniref:Mnt2p n=1 Tax=Sugiyamaella lignohabitans TaxID=796027 RepID=A0A167DN99_9ASCO|nr:Mnt2p [Sugiyamaella lignohabitans]ANB13098.1 Mnt2p [Sugiyamaella lignohabitans]
MYFISTANNGHLHKPLQRGNRELTYNFNYTKDAIRPAAQYFIEYPVKGPKYRDQFGEFGNRIQVLRQWVELSDLHNDQDFLENTVEKMARATVPFIINKEPDNIENPTPFSDLRRSFVPGSKGIIISTGNKAVRYAIHLAVSIREVFNCSLPILITYAGPDDLQYLSRETFSAIVENIEFADLSYAFNEDITSLRSGEYAVKPFSALVSKFEHNLILDADTVLLQSPEVFFEQQGYKDTGALFFHDRLLNETKFKESVLWRKKQLGKSTPSKQLNLTTPLTWIDRYSEQADAGAVVLDKSRLSVLMGLLHTCWQNTRAVRDEVTFQLGHGDKETWWFGFELSNSSYSFDKSFGIAIGELTEKNKDDEKDVDKVCGFALAHTDQDDKLLWYNGGLLKNRNGNQTEFNIPRHWMTGGSWNKIKDNEMSCMRNSTVHELTPEETTILSRTIMLAKKYDQQEQLIDEEAEKEKEREEKERKEKEEKEKKIKEEKEKKIKEEKEKKEKEEKEKKEKEEKEKKEKEEKEQKEKEKEEKVKQDEKDENEKDENGDKAKEQNEKKER